MIIVNINSGLGNQMFHYALYLQLRKSNPDEEIYVDKSIFESSNMQWKYELERVFNISMQDIKEVMSKSEYSYYLEKQKECVDKLPHNWLSKAAFMSSNEMIDIFSEGLHCEWKIITDLASAHKKSFKHDFLVYLKGVPIISDMYYMIKNRGKQYNLRPFYRKIRGVSNVDNTRLKDGRYLDSILVMDGIYNNYFVGNFEVAPIYFKDVQKEVKSSFVFPELDSENQEYAKKIINSKSVAIHLRRGDHLVSNSIFFKEGGYYSSAVRYIKSKVNAPVFFVFSDDLQWCKNNLNILGINNMDNVIFVEGNVGKNSYKDMQLMSLCNHNIIPISTFSWWASYLNEHEDKIVIAPKGYWAEATVYL